MKIIGTNAVLALAVMSTTALANPTGMKPLTTTELKTMEKVHGMKRVKKIKPNKLGLTRINWERARKGQQPLPTTDAVEIGQDTEVDTEWTVGGGATSADADGMFAGALPATVDNSSLNYFPTIGAQTWNNCVAWAMGYYQLSHNIALAMNYSPKSDVTKRCSPKFIYNMINSGVDQGAYFSDGLNMISKHGCVSWDKWPEDMDYKGWNLNPEHWQSAIGWRTNPYQTITAMDTQAGLDQAKALLNNGYVLSFGTYINSWQYTTIKANPNAYTNPLAGQKVTHWMNGTNGGHAMTIVGYDDNAWVDINSNNYVDAGELGVFKIANSWGTSWGNAGFIFMAYDAIKTYSAVSGGPATARVGAFQNKLAFHQPVKASGGALYTPKYLAKFNVNHAARNQLSVKFGYSSSSYTTPTTTFTPFALVNRAGAYAFNGTTTAQPATFVMDISELPISESTTNKIYMTLADSASGSSATLNSFEVLDVARGTSATAAMVTPAMVDYSSKTVSLNYTASISNSAPLASFNASVTSGVAPVTVNFDGAASYDNDGSIATYSWNFGDGYSSTGSYVSHAYQSAGTYTATLTVTDDDGATNSTSKTITVSSGTVTPPTTADTTLPSVALTSPATGSRFKRYSTVTATATASDNRGVNRVKFYVSGKVKCTDYSAPYSCSFSMPSGTSIPVKARAYDAAGNDRTSTSSYISSY